jgi:cytochrome P450
LLYVCATIKEAMYIYPSVALSILRYALKDSIKLAGYFILDGYRIRMNPAVVYYNKEDFREDADKYRLER